MNGEVSAASSCPGGVASPVNGSPAPAVPAASHDAADPRAGLGDPLGAGEQHHLRWTSAPAESRSGAARALVGNR